MAVDLRLPNINKEASPAQKIDQLQSYIYQLVQQLNWALNFITAEEKSLVVQEGSAAGEGEVTPVETFNSIKSLIIKSADIIDAYTDQMELTFDGRYTAQSDFGEFTQTTQSRLDLDSQSITQNYRAIQTITESVDALETYNQIIDGYIRTGADIGGSGKVGVEIGEQREINGSMVFQKYCRLVSDRLSFYDANGNEIAYISDQQMHITSAHIVHDVRIGNYKLYTSNGLAFKWEDA